MQSIYNANANAIHDSEPKSDTNAEHLSDNDTVVFCVANADLFADAVFEPDGN